MGGERHFVATCFFLPVRGFWLWQDKEDNPMQADVFEGKWRQMRGELRSWWGKLTDSDFERVAGKKDRLIGLLQEKYGYTREAAQQEIDRRFKEYDERTGSPGPGKREQSGGSPSQNYRTKFDPKEDEATRATEETSSAGMNKGTQPISAVGEKIGSLADIIRDKAPHEGTVGSAASTVADKLDAAGSYLQQKNVDHMMGDLSDMIRRHPVPALLIGLGIGYLLARAQGGKRE
jgi:uncharacterized protein YjbJ (UPF0337 family)